MSLMSFTITPNFPVLKKHNFNDKWRTCHSNLRYHDSRHLKQTDTSRLTSNATPLIKLNVTSPSLLNKRSDYVTKAAAAITPKLVAPELEKKPNGGFWFRKWDSIDVTNVCWLAVVHVLGVCAPFMFDWRALWMAVGLGCLTGMGITLGYHRLLTHRSFKIPKWLEYFFVYCGVHAGQKDPIFWVSTHKYHHKHADTDRDPHGSPTKDGFWFSHMGWFFDNNSIASKCGETRSGEYTNVPEIKAQWFYRFLQGTYYWQLAAVASLLYLLGGLPYLAWGLGFRTMITLHVTFLVDSVSHLWGDRPWNTPDNSTSHWLPGLFALGEGWHNNHHAFPRSAQHGLERWQFDLTWELIKFLEFIGLATNVKLPTDSDKRRMAVLGTNKTKKQILGLDHDV